ncbi:MAG: AhpC/TSA family protein [Dysgonamonadaceae bacterium]|jgi:peroxiredoxin|nr:AhpC/TSA family protein [Dysgonamonadaceae bacterium]
MKNLILSVAVICATTMYADNGNLSVKGETAGVSSGKVYLQKFANKMFFVIDSAQIVDGKFSFARNAELPELYGLTLDTAKTPYLVFLDQHPATVKLDTANYYRNTAVTGSELQDLFVSYRKQRGVKIDEFIRNHPASLVSAYVLYRDYSYRLTADEIQSNIEHLSPSLRNTPYVQALKELIKTRRLVDIGKPAPDFTSFDPAGNPVQLSALLGKGYLLVDFWASWCAPCRKENPNVVKAYRKYKDKGFDILGVSLDKSREGWLKAIEKDSLTWTHASDLLYWNSKPAQLYGVRAIPANVLIDKNGIIVGWNLRGKDLDSVLEDLYARDGGNAGRAE